MTHDNNSPLSKRIAMLASRRTESQNEAIRRHAKKIAHDFRDGNQSRDFPEGYGADMESFLRDLSQKWRAVRSAKAENMAEPTTALEYRPRGIPANDPFDVTENNVSDDPYEEKESDNENQFSELVPMAASAGSLESGPALTEFTIDVEGTSVRIWRNANNAMIQYCELKSDPRSIHIDNTEFFLSEYEEDPRFAQIVGLSIPALVRLMR